MSDNKLAQQFEVYSEWRKSLVDAICDYRSWLNEQELNDQQSDQRIAQLPERRLTIYSALRNCLKDCAKTSSMWLLWQNFHAVSQS